MTRFSNYTPGTLNSAPTKLWSLNSPTLPFKPTTSTPAVLCDDGCSDYDDAPYQSAVSQPALFAAAYEPKKLRDHQIDSIEALRGSFKSGKRRPLLCCPTGAGKTVIAANIVKCAIIKRGRLEYAARRPVCAYFLVPRIDLLGQTEAAFKSEGIFDVGVLGGGHRRNLDAPVIITTWQSLKNRKPLDKADLVLIDEAHMLPKFVQDWMTDPEWASTPFVGLTATPSTKGLGKFFDDLVIGETTQGLIDKGLLSPFRAFAPKSGLKPRLTPEFVRTTDGDYQEKMLSKEMQRPQLVADAVQTWLEKGENRPTLCFAVDRAHAHKLQGQFAKAGVKTAYIDAYTPVEERAEIGRKLKTGEVQVCVNIMCMTVGVDLPHVSCIVLCRPTKSEALYVQIIGRGLRVSPGKADCLILDHSDTTVRLGFVTDIIFDKLDDGTKHANSKAKERDEPLPKECVMCGHVKPAKVHVCPNCGHEPKRQSKIEHEDGELAEVNGKAIKWDKATKQAWYSQFLFIALEKGFKPGWAANKYREKFGVWPRCLNEIVQIPTQEVRNYITARNIAWSKRRAG